MKFTDTELSTILGAHEAGLLATTAFEHQFMCLIMCARNKPRSTVTYTASEKRAADWFDWNYQPSCSSKSFLSQLEGQGLA